MSVQNEYLCGTLVPCGEWDVALTDAEVVMVAAEVLVRPSNFVIGFHDGVVRYMARAD